MSEIHYATGRRKTSSARVYLSKGKGDITVNSKPLNEYFGRQVAQMLVMQPLKLTELDEKVNIKVMVKGGGSFGQAGAILSLIHISEPTRLLSISYAVFC